MTRKMATAVINSGNGYFHFGPLSHFDNGTTESTWLRTTSYELDGTTIPLRLSSQTWNQTINPPNVSYDKKFLWAAVRTDDNNVTPRKMIDSKITDYTVVNQTGIGRLSRGIIPIDNSGFWLAKAERWTIDSDNSGTTVYMKWSSGDTSFTAFE